MANTIVVADLLQKETIRQLDNKIVALNFADRAYEGQLKQQGDTVRVQTFPDLAFTAHTGGDIAAQDVNITSEIMQVNQNFSNRFAWEDTEQVRSNLPVVSKTANKIAKAMREAYETHLLTTIVGAANIPATNKIAARTITPTNSYQLCVDLGVQLRKQNVTEDMIYLVPPEFTGMLTQHKWFDASNKGTEVRHNGFMGKAYGGMVYETNMLPAPTAPNTSYVIAMEKNAVNFVSQISKLKVNEAEKGFYTNVLAHILFQAHVFNEKAKRIAFCPVQFG